MPVPDVSSKQGLKQIIGEWVECGVIGDALQGSPELELSPVVANIISKSLHAIRYVDGRSDFSEQELEMAHFLLDDITGIEFKCLTAASLSSFIRRLQKAVELSRLECSLPPSDDEKVTCVHEDISIIASIILYGKAISVAAVPNNWLARYFRKLYIIP